MRRARALFQAVTRRWRPPPAEPPLDIVGPLTQAHRLRLRALLAHTPTPPERTALHLRIETLDNPAFAKNAILSLEDIRWPDSLRYGFVEFTDAVVTPYGFVIANGGVIFSNQRLPNGWMRGDNGDPDLIARLFEANFIHKFNVWRGTCWLSLPPAAELVEIDEPTFLFDSRLTCFNFAHLVHDTLIQTPTFHDCRAHIGAEVTPLLAGPGFTYPVMGEIFARAVGRQEPIFIGRRFLKVRRLFVPTTHFSPSGWAIARGAVARLRATLGASLASFARPVQRRLFISRDDSNRGDDREPRFANSAALEQALAQLGFEKLVVSRLGVEDYLETFVNAEIIVGLHGAGLLNLLLCAHPRMVELTVPGYPDWGSLRLVMEVGMGAPYRRVTMAAPENGVAHYDIPAILDACRALLATPSPPCPQPAHRL